MTQTISSLPAVFLQMKEADEFVDITLVFGKQRIACHKVILAGMCDYFRRMFLTNMLERGSQEVVLKDISASTGVLLVEYLYSGNIDITQLNAQDLLAASEMLLLGALKKKVEDFLLSHTDSVNCISIINLARLYDLKILLADARNYLQEHVKEVVETEEMHLLQEGDLIEVLEANVSQEENFLFIQKWMRSAEGRTDRFEDLMQHVSLSQCSKDFVCNTVMAEKLMHNTQGMTLIQEFMRS
ncbi:MAG: BTB/POZ domain-containing protein, partial [Kangiellaceae bacterium]|nr:BTB/POZ domain-containing protein [Kangiellaceae bacterium]